MACRDQMLNLIGPLKNVKDLGIPIKLLHDLSVQTGGSQQLQTSRTYFQRNLSGVGFAHGGFLGVGLADIGFPCRFPGKQTRRLDLQFRTGQLLRSQVIESSMFRILFLYQVPCIFKSGTGDSDRHRGHDGPGIVKSFHRHPKA